MRRLSLVPFLLALTAGAATAQTPPKPVLAPIVPRIEAIIHRTQPAAEVGFGQDVLIAQYRTTNFTVHPRDKSGKKQRPYPELGPLHGGFYLQVDVAYSAMQARPQTTRPTADQPWTTVLSFYPISKGRTIVMTWEAAPEAPRGLAPQVSQLLSAFSSRAR